MSLGIAVTPALPGPTQVTLKFKGTNAEFKDWLNALDFYYGARDLRLSGFYYYLRSPERRSPS